MAMTTITITNAPASLRGDLTKWMQEIATGVYIGNLNSRVREELWKRVKQSVGKGQATLCYAKRNELGYQFRTHRTKQINVSFDGIPLVMIPKEEVIREKDLQIGFSNQSKYRKAQKYASNSKKEQSIVCASYIVLDIETTGLNPVKDDIIEIAAIKIELDKSEVFRHFILIENQLPEEIVKLTGITDKILASEGRNVSQVLEEFIEFIEGFPIIGYNLQFDVKFINNKLISINKPTINNKKIDLMSLVKKEKMFLKSYKLQDVLLAYEIDGNITHRALEDANLAYLLSTKVNGLAYQLSRKG